MRISDHCISRIVSRTRCPFDFDGIREQIMILLFASGCTMKGFELVKTRDGTFVLENGTVVTFLDSGWRAKKRKRKGRRRHYDWENDLSRHPY